MEPVAKSIVVSATEHNRGTQAEKRFAEKKNIALPDYVDYTLSEPNALLLDMTVQGLPFYTGNITYHIPVETEGGELSVRSGFYIGAMQEASIDGNEPVPMIYPPYIASLGAVEVGKHTIELTLYGTRQNGFGALHLATSFKIYTLHKYN